MFYFIWVSLCQFSSASHFSFSGDKESYSSAPITLVHIVCFFSWKFWMDVTYSFLFLFTSWSEFPVQEHPLSFSERLFFPLPPPFYPWLLSPMSSFLPYEVPIISGYQYWYCLLFSSSLWLELWTIRYQTCVLFFFLMFAKIYKKNFLVKKKKKGIKV